MGENGDSFGNLKESTCLQTIFDVLKKTEVGIKWAHIKGRVVYLYVWGLSSNLRKLNVAGRTQTPDHCEPK